MKDLPISLDTTVAEALETDKGVSRVFLNHKTACVGCYLARFCTIRDVVKAYGLAVEPFLGQLRQAEHANLSDPIGAQNDQ